MSNAIFLPSPEDFSFRHAVTGHGWYDLLPFKYDEVSGRLNYVYYDHASTLGHEVSMESVPGGIKVRTATRRKTEAIRVEAVARHILRLDEDLGEFYTAVRPDPNFAWVTEINAGRLLRSATVYEDLVKTLCTTNCTWALTKLMVTNLVTKLGHPGVGGGRAFPSPEALASVPEQYFRTEIKAGYRSPYFVELAEAVASGRLRPEEWLHSDLPTPELKKEMKKVKGIGDYAADNLLKLVGRYDGLALDSWLRAGFYRKHNREKPCSDKKIERHYRKFGKWRGLAIWCDMTKHWFETKPN